MKFEDALRKVIAESEEEEYEFAKRASYNYSDLFHFLDNNQKLSITQMQRLFDALSSQDKQKWVELIIKNNS